MNTKSAEMQSHIDRATQDMLTLIKNSGTRQLNGKELEVMFTSGITLLATIATNLNRMADAAEQLVEASKK
jgi:hypothetical protein